jgi:hypothetical protein
MILAQIIPLSFLGVVEGTVKEAPGKAMVLQDTPPKPYVNLHQYV